MIGSRAGALAGGMLLLLGVSARPAAACSPVQGYKVPTALELADAADTIVIARVDGERKAGDPYEGAVLATPVALLKGSAMPHRIEIEGTELVDAPVGVSPSDPRELRRPNSDALSGGCVRRRFRAGTRLLLFLKQGEDGKPVPYRAPFSRDAEDVSGPGALWAKAVREYAAIAALPAAARPAAMSRRIAALRASGDADSAAIAGDLAIELARVRRPPSR